MPKWSKARPVNRVVGSTMKDIMTYVAEAAKEGITLEVTELNDYNTLTRLYWMILT